MNSGEKVSLTLTVTAYAPGVVHDSFDDGSFEIFDEALLLIVKGERTGEKVSVMIDAQDAEQVALWNRPGIEIRVSVDRDFLDPNIILFSTLFEIEDTNPPVA